MVRFNRRSSTADTEQPSIACPFCGSTDTVLEQRKGTAMCRKMFVCQQCGEPFEQFD
ncbi:PaaD-like zinc ribbon domain-containing protein [Halobacterium sp. KA-6]|uniref:PaaD-like zinc ribbon domain-containing protein n=1 Tax=Halobacterium sp. KA-6 TaxID=2896368 RepID=UPI003FA578C8